MTKAIIAPKGEIPAGNFGNAQFHNLVDTTAITTGAGDFDVYLEATINGAATFSVTGNETAPSITNLSYDDATGVLTFDIDEPATIYLATHLAANTLTPDGSGGWTGTTIETFSGSVSDGVSRSFSFTATDETADRFTLYARDAAGDDSSTFTETITFPPEADVIPHNDFVQDVDFSAVNDSETTAAAFTKAGTFLVFLTDVCSNLSTFVLSGSAVTSATVVDVKTDALKGSDSGGAVYRVVTSGASDLTVTTDNSFSSFNRGISIHELVGIDTTGAIFGHEGTDTQTGDAAESVVLSSVPAGAFVLAASVSRASNSSGATWGGGFAASDEVAGSDIARGASRSSTALKETTAAGDFTASVDFVGSDGAAFNTTFAIALIPGS